MHPQKLQINDEYLRNVYKMISGAKTNARTFQKPE